MKTNKVDSTSSRALDFPEGDEAPRKQHQPPSSPATQHEYTSARNSARNSRYERGPETETGDFQSRHRNSAYQPYRFLETEPMADLEEPPIPGPDVFHYFYWYVFSHP